MRRPFGHDCSGVVATLSASIVLWLAAASLGGVTTYTRSTRSESSPAPAQVAASERQQSPNASSDSFVARIDPATARTIPETPEETIDKDTSLEISPPEPPQAIQAPPAAPRPRAVSGIQLSSQKRTTDNPFQLSPTIAQSGGWLRLMRERLATDYERGYRVFLLHRPLGEPPPDSIHQMQIDAAIEIADSRFAYVVRDFEDAMIWARENLPQAVFICYVGTLDEDLLEMIARDRWSAFRARILQSLRPYLSHPNADIAFDASARFETGSFMHRAYLEIKAIKSLQGRETYIESLPRILEMFPDHTWGFHENAIIFENVFWNQIKHDRLGLPIQLELGKRPSATLRWWTGHDPEKWDGDHLTWLRDVLERGHVPVINTAAEPFQDISVIRLIALASAQ